MIFDFEKESVLERDLLLLLLLLFSLSIIRVKKY